MATYTEPIYPPTENFSLNMLIGYLQNFANAHKMIKSFTYGPRYDFGREGTAISPTNYPVLWIEPVESRAHKSHLELKFNMYMLDLNDKANLNRYSIHSDTLQTLLDLKAFLNKDFSFYLIPGEDTEMRPVWEGFDDDLAGWRFDMIINVLWYSNACDIPGVTPWQYPQQTPSFFAIFQNQNHILFQNQDNMIFNN